MGKTHDESWKEQWKGMPEFEQEDLTSKRKIIIHFRNDEDVQKFAELIGQEFTPKQKSTWFPYMPPRKASHLRYVDGDES